MYLLCDEDLITSEHNALRLQDVNTEDKVWLWSEGFVDSVYQGGSTIGRSNTMLGALRMRQLRCQPSTCSVQTEIDPNATVCYPQLSGSGDQDQFGTNQTYSFSSESGFGWTSGMTGLEYPASGFVTPLSQDSKTEALTTLASMKASQWIDLQTRFVAFEVNTYNPNVDLVTTVLVAFELDASGGVYGSYVTSPFRLFRYYTATDWVILAMEILIVAYIGVFVVLESKKIRNALELGHIKLYLTDGWSLLEWFNAIGFFLSVILRIVFLAKAASFSLDPAKPEFQNMRAISDLFEVESLVAAVNSFILYIQVFKYLVKWEGISRLGKILLLAFDDVNAFWVLFVITQFAFAQSAWLLFGSQVPDQSTVTAAFQTSLLIAYGVQSSYSTLIEKYPITGGLWLVMYLTTFVFVMMNIFISIVVYSFNQMKSADSSVEDLLKWFPFRSALTRRYSAIAAVKTGQVKAEVAELSKELSERVIEHERVQLSDATRYVRDYPLCCAVLSVETAEDIMQRYDSDLCGTLDAAEMSELKADLLKRLKIAQQMAVQMDSVSLLPENPYEQWDDDAPIVEDADELTAETNPLSHNKIE
eukprot:TRINITY_DN1876_c0_g1_i7.p1 TRINITY_DN1876_c0_g1~~TRINITY_DN1876_c0_g1_i7.p1  ORF type:complete len:588 (-),score=114.42 TRINITY_DN1876_c0_g1_i7:159-1922(-)